MPARNGLAAPARWLGVRLGYFVVVVLVVVVVVVVVVGCCC